MPETYNPRDRSFIKMPEIKYCAACGQPLPSDFKPMNNFMSRYISVEGKVSVLNSNEDTIKIKQGDVTVILYKVTGKNEKNQEISSFMPVPEVPKQPTK
jgi:hypothetical protein